MNWSSCMVSECKCPGCCCWIPVGVGRMLSTEPAEPPKPPAPPGTANTGSTPSTARAAAANRAAHKGTVSAHRGAACTRSEHTAFVPPISQGLIFCVINPALLCSPSLPSCCHQPGVMNHLTQYAASWMWQHVNWNSKALEWLTRNVRIRGGFLFGWLVGFFWK